MNKMLNEVMPGCISPGDVRTTDILNQSYKLLEDEANSSALEFGTAINNTEEMRSYNFKLNIPNSSGKYLPVSFLDFPGGWMNADNNTNDSIANYNRLKNAVQESDVIIAAVNMPYLVESKGKYSDRAGIADMQKLFKVSLDADKNKDKLILIVPIKCEKYEVSDVLKRIEKAFSDTIAMTEDLNYKNRLALAIVPVYTVGNARFSRFEAANGNISREIYLKQANSKFSPLNVDQPVRFAMSFLLSHFSLPANMRNVTEAIQSGMRLNDSSFKIISGISLITGEGVRNRIEFNVDNNLSGENNSSSGDSNINENIKIDNIKNIKLNSGTKYKIAVMGATGVGKTIFWGSYFYMVLNQAKGKYSIAPISQSSANKITDLIKQLFERREIAMGTSESVDFSFFTRSPKMEVELFDIPGGYTQDMNDWVREKILPDLKQADGAVFFISGDDLINHSERTLRDNAVFLNAVSLLRETSGSEKFRADVPIQFIITKGDLIPDVSLETLKEKIAALIKSAKASDDEDIIVKTFFKKGSYVNIYKTEAMGKWPSATTLPDNYKPENVIEPMDTLLDSMYKSRHAHKSTVRKLLIGTATVVLMGMWGALYFWDHNNWNKASAQLDTALQKADYAAAQSILDNFKSPTFMSFLYPEFVRADSKIKDGYAKYEAALYSLINADLKTVNPDVMPADTKDFRDAASRVDRYLSVKNFLTVAPEHYERVNSQKWYFDVGRLFNFDLNQAVSSQEEILHVIHQCLNQNTPEKWAVRVQEKIEALIRAWSQALPLDVAPDVLDSYIEKADIIAGNSKIKNSLKNYINNQKNRWTAAKDQRWRIIADEWIREAGNDPEKAVAVLEARLMEKQGSQSDVLVKNIQKAIDKNYLTLVENWLIKYRSENDISQLKTLMNDYPKMSAEAKKLLNSGINELERIRIGKTAAQLVRSKTLDELSREVGKIGVDADNDTIRKAVNSAMNELMKRELNDIKNSVTGYIKDGRLEAAKAELTGKSGELRKSINPLIMNMSQKNRNIMLEPVNNFERNAINELQGIHLDKCRQAFNRIKNTRNSRDISSCCNDLNGFLMLWPDTENAKIIRKVLDFLTTIGNGVEGTLRIKNGDFSKFDRMLDTPDVFVYVVEDSDGQQKSYRTKTLNDSVTPDFDESIRYKWSVNNTHVTFIAFDENLTSNEELMRQQVNVSGIFGYKNLNQVLRNNGCTLVIGFDAQIPECPWN